MLPVGLFESSYLDFASFLAFVLESEAETAQVFFHQILFWDNSHMSWTFLLLNIVVDLGCFSEEFVHLELFSLFLEKESG